MFEAIVLVVLLAFGGTQYVQKNSAEKEAERLETQLQEAQEDTKAAIKANESNVITITEIDNSLQQCLAVVEEYEVIKESFAVDNSSDQADLETLEVIVDDYDWSSDRIPSGLLDRANQDRNED